MNHFSYFQFSNVFNSLLFNTSRQCTIQSLNFYEFANRTLHYLLITFENCEKSTNDSKTNEKKIVILKNNKNALKNYKIQKKNK